MNIFILCSDNYNDKYIDNGNINIITLPVGTEFKMSEFQLVVVLQVMAKKSMYLKAINQWITNKTEIFAKNREEPFEVYKKVMYLINVDSEIMVKNKNGKEDIYKNLNMFRFSINKGKIELFTRDNKEKFVKNINCDELLEMWKINESTQIMINYSEERPEETASFISKKDRLLVIELNKNHLNEIELEIPKEITTNMMNVLMLKKDGEEEKLEFTSIDKFYPNKFKDFILVNNITKDFLLSDNESFTLDNMVTFLNEGELTGKTEEEVKVVKKDDIKNIFSDEKTNSLINENKERDAYKNKSSYSVNEKLNKELDKRFENLFKNDKNETKNTIGPVIFFITSVFYVIAVSSCIFFIFKKIKNRKNKKDKEIETEKI